MGSDVTELGSTCLALGQALLTPMLFVKENARLPDDKVPLFLSARVPPARPRSLVPSSHFPHPFPLAPPQEPIRFMVALEQSSAATLKFVLSLMRPFDKLFLVRCSLKEETGPASQRQRMLDQFIEAAAELHVKAEPVLGTGKTSEALPEAVKAKKIDVMCLQVCGRWEVGGKGMRLFNLLLRMGLKGPFPPSRLPSLESRTQAPKLKTMSETLKKIVIAVPCSVLLFKFDASMR